MLEELLKSRATISRRLTRSTYTHL